VAFVSVEFRLSERTACKLLDIERSSYLLLARNPSGREIAMS
jgi:hypothetical protein